MVFDSFNAEWKETTVPISFLLYSQTNLQFTDFFDLHKDSQIGLSTDGLMGTAKI